MPGTRQSQRRHQIPRTGVRVLSHHMAPRNWTRVPAKAAAALSLQPSVHYSSIERVFLRFIFMSIGWLCPHDMSVHHMHAWYLCKTEEGSGFPKTEISDSDELPCGLWELNLGPLQEQPMILTVELPLQPQMCCFFKEGKETVKYYFRLKSICLF